MAVAVGATGAAGAERSRNDPKRCFDFENNCFDLAYPGGPNNSFLAETFLSGHNYAVPINGFFPAQDGNQTGLSAMQPERQLRLELIHLKFY